MLWESQLGRFLPPAGRLIEFCALAALSVGALFATAAIGLAPRDSAGGVAVIYAPWTPPDLALQRTVEAGARFVRFGGPNFIAIAIPDDADFISRVRAAGALLIVDPRAIAACLSPFGVAKSKP
jgi:hypothetical protein